jgi:hypothetical protein
MRKEPRISKRQPGAATRAGAPRSRRVADGRRAEPDEAADCPLTAAQTREIKRRVADLEDPIRYLLVSRMGPRFSLYYNVSDDLYAMNDPTGATLFKRRKAAESVRRTLGRGVDILQCQTRKSSLYRTPR